MSSATPAWGTPAARFGETPVHTGEVNGKLVQWLKPLRTPYG